MSEPETYTGNDTGYRVEVRARTRPFIVGTEIVDTEWRPMPLVHHVPPPVGVTSRGFAAHGALPGVQDCKDLLTHSYSYYAALALASTWYAQGDNAWRSEVRLVPFKRIVKYELTRGEPREFDNELMRMTHGPDLPVGKGAE